MIKSTKKKIVQKNQDKKICYKNLSNIIKFPVHPKTLSVIFFSLRRFSFFSALLVAKRSKQWFKRIIELNKVDKQLLIDG